MTLYKICFYAPVSHAQTIKTALFAAGAGQVGLYSHCCWQVLGEGQYMPLSGSDAHLGHINKLEKVPEYKIEMVCSAEFIHLAIKALKEAHPYEEPAYQVIRVEEF